MSAGNIPASGSAPNPQGVFGVTPLPPMTLVAGVASVVTSLAASNVRGVQSDIQCVFVDASLAIDPVIVRSQRSGQYTIWRAGSYGWQPLLVQMPSNLEVFSTAAATVTLQVATGVIAAALFDANVIRSSETSVHTQITPTNVVGGVDLLVANVRRQGFSIYNPLTAGTLYMLAADETPSATNYTLPIAPGGYYESPYDYGGVVRGVWSAAGGGNDAQITEYL